MTTFQSGVRLVWAALLLVGTAMADEEGFRSIFDGRSLAGWETPDPSYWTVDEGAITARITKDHPCSANQYLVWQGGELADFELKLKSRVNGEGGINNGFQFRSRLLPDHDVCGYQVDNNLQTPWLVRLYDEFGRHTLAWRGEQAVFDAEGNRSVTKIAAAEGTPWFRLEDWHEYHLACVGRRITLRVDGRLAAVVEDNDPRRRELQGILALQLHSGPPTVAQFKDIRLKEIKAATPAHQSSPVPVEQKLASLQRDAIAWWPLDTGGHGAQPPLRHIPGWEKFELNVRAAGPGAWPGTKVVILEGAYFDAGPELHGGENAVTVYLRARDPRGVWDAALFAKRGGHDQLHFNLFSVDLPETPGPDIGFEIRTDRGFAMVSFPVSDFEATSWHDLVGRYDGKTLELFCDGRHMAGKPWSGILQKNREPLLIGAETDAGKVVRQFHGELEVAALWSRALTDDEVTALSSAGPIRGEVIINRTNAAWESQQVQEPCILPNPKDPARLVMFYSGVPATNRNTCFIGKAWALKSDPFTWHQDEHNPVFSPGKLGWDSGSIRLDAVLHVPEEDAYYIYYSGTTASVQDRIGLAICPAGADGYSGISPATIQRVGTQPVLAPEPAAPYFEEMASQAAVLREWNPQANRWDWFMYYSYRGKDGILPGLRLATSHDGKTWTRYFNDNDPRGMGQIFPSTPGAYYEWHQVFKIGGTYLLSIEVGIEAGKRWRPLIAVSKDPVTGWAQTDVDAVLQTKWAGLYRDDTIYHVATPAFYQVEGKWYLYTQACPLPGNGNYIDGHWDLWCFACDRLIPTLPGYESIYIPGQPTAAGVAR